MFERSGDVCWLRGEPFGGKATAVGARLHRTRRHSMETLRRERFAEWQDGQGCKSDVKVLLHFERAKTVFSSRESPFFGAGDIRVLLQRKKSQGLFECNRIEE